MRNGLVHSWRALVIGLTVLGFSATTHTQYDQPQKSVGSSHKSYGRTNQISHALPIPVFGPNGLAPRGQDNEYPSGNWSGYALIGSAAATYKSAQGTWIVPTALYKSYTGVANNSCVNVPSPCEVSSTWVGIGAAGDLTNPGSDSSLIQIGTEQDVSSAGASAYFAWFEVLPRGETKITSGCLPASLSSCPVSAGDVITAKVECTATCIPGVSQSWKLSMSDSSKGWTWSISDFPYASSLASSEWIMEATCVNNCATTNPTISPLPNYGSVPFSGVIVNGAQPNLLPADEVVMNDNGGVSTPCAYNSQSNQFTVVYGAVTSINTVTDLQNVNNESLAGNYCVAQKFDASATAGWNGGAGFIPIGTPTQPFTGLLDGQGFAIDGLAINVTNASPTNQAGLFGYISSSGIVQNVQLTNVSISASGTNNDAAAGGLVGANFGRIVNSYTSGNVSASTSTGHTAFVGGLVAENLGTIITSASAANVTGGVVGGLVGTQNGGSIDQSFAVGPVTAGAGGSGSNGTAGGLVGVQQPSTAISQSYASGPVSVGPLGHAGGLVGQAQGTISQSYAIGNVTSPSFAGGLVALNFSATISQSYWDTQTTGQPASAGGTGLTTAQFLAGLPSGFDPTAWGSSPFTNCGFPYLLWNLLTDCGRLTATPTSGPAPLAVTLTASGLPLPMTYTINFGDGTTGALTQSSCIGVAAIVGGQSGSQCSGSASHIYTAAGSYTATLLNALGLTVGTAAITVTSAAPKVSIALPNKAGTLGSQTIPAPQDVQGETLEVPVAGGNATVPTISSFTSSPASIASLDGSGSATLFWSVASATSLSISGLGAVIGNSIQVSPSQTTTYTLTASNAQGSVTAETKVTVVGYR
jgi:PKD domain